MSFANTAVNKISNILLGLRSPTTNEKNSGGFGDPVRPWEDTITAPMAIMFGKDKHNKDPPPSFFGGSDWIRRKKPAETVPRDRVWVEYPLPIVLFDKRTSPFLDVYLPFPRSFVPSHSTRLPPFFVDGDTDVRHGRPILVDPKTEEEKEKIGGSMRNFRGKRRIGRMIEQPQQQIRLYSTGGVLRSIDLIRPFVRPIDQPNFKFSTNTADTRCCPLPTIAACLGLWNANGFVLPIGIGPWYWSLVSSLSLCLLLCVALLLVPRARLKISCLFFIFYF